MEGWTPIDVLYPQSEVKSEWGDYFSAPYDYSDILNSFGYEVLLKIDDNDYQGDSRVLYLAADRFGILIFGWGSCSGCDALQACNNLTEVDELRTDLHSQIKWFDSLSEALSYFEKHDWEGDYCWHQEETHEFISKSKALLEQHGGPNV